MGIRYLDSASDMCTTIALVVDGRKDDTKRVAS